MASEVNEATPVTVIICADSKCGVEQMNTLDFCWKCGGPTKWIAESTQGGVDAQLAN